MFRKRFVNGRSLAADGPGGMAKAERFTRYFSVIEAAGAAPGLDVAAAFLAFEAADF